MTLTEFLLARIAEDEAALLSPHGVNAYADRMWAECEAKRRIVEHVGWVAKVDPSDRRSGADGLFFAVLQDLALPYADHPDYRQEWKP